MPPDRNRAKKEFICNLKCKNVFTEPRLFKDHECSKKIRNFLRDCHSFPFFQGINISVLCVQEKNRIGT